MTKSLVITFEEKDENLLMAFFNRLKIKARSIPNERDKNVQKRVDEAVESGYWASLTEDEKEDFVFGCMLDEIDTTKTVETNDFIKKMQARLQRI